MDMPNRAIATVPWWLNSKFSNKMTWRESSEISREEIEIEAKILRAGRAVGVVKVELRKKKTRKILANARYTKYLAPSSNL
ncbi:phosphoribosylamine--glycine ligase [Musa troglodytarum]|uniref:Phosphoribosylamine--glycine ligase n=1 Tax=Musa troglodytarum TaxID=320322 RepID=A0A9E7HVB4_9LILI|nr:phosphoribosylamine--glycine ligase [Musa troglodytarum]